jgi:hypothetical protein
MLDAEPLETPRIVTPVTAALRSKKTAWARTLNVAWLPLV